MLRDWDEYEKYYPDEETSSPRIRRFLQESTKLDVEYGEQDYVESIGIPNSGVILSQRDLFQYEQNSSLRIREEYAKIAIGDEETKQITVGEDQDFIK